MNLIAQQTLGERWLAAAGAQTWQLTVMAVVVWLITRLACRHRPHLAYLLWMLVVVKAITPPLWSSPAGAFSWMQVRREAAALTELRFTDFGTPALTPPVPGVAAPENPAPVAPTSPTTVDAHAPKSSVFSLSIAQVRLSIWAGGSLALLGVTLFRWLRIQRLLARTAQPAERELAAQFQALAQQVGLRRPVQLLITSTPLGPAVFGWWPGTVLLPASLVAECAPDRLRQVLAHELVHLRRGDTLAATLQLAAQSVWWYHPAVWWANRQARFERERACDEEVVAAMNCEPAEYARMLVDILEWRHRLSSALAWPGMRAWDVTTQRLQSVLKPAHCFNARTPRWSWLILLLAALVLLPGAGLRLAAATDESDPAPPVVPAPAAAAPRAQSVVPATSAAAKIIQRLAAAGLQVNSQDDQGQTTYHGFFTDKFQPPEKPLPLDQLPGLQSIFVGAAHVSVEQLSAQLRACEDLPAGALLALTTSDQSAPACEALASIKHLQKLSLQGPLTPAVLASLARLTGLKNLSLIATKRDETISLAWIEGLTNLEQLGLAAQIATDEDAGRIARLAKLRQLSLDFTHLSDEGLKLLTTLPSLRVLFLSSTHNDLRVTPAGMASLGALRSLRRLIVTHVTEKNAAPVINDDVLLAWRNLAELRDLWIHGCRLTQKGAGVLTAWPRLRRLRLMGEGGIASLPADCGQELIELTLGGAALSNEGLETIAALPNLRTLSLNQAHSLGEEGLGPLGAAEQLTSLSVEGAKLAGTAGAGLTSLRRLMTLRLLNCQIDNRVIAAVLAMTDLRTLGLVGVDLTDQQAQQLASFPLLNDLDLSKNPIGDETLAALAPLKHLQQLKVVDTKSTSAGQQRLKESIPNLNLDTGGLSWATLEFFPTDLVDDPTDPAPAAKEPAPNSSSQKASEAPAEAANLNGPALRGHVTDAAGQPVPGVTITLWNGVATRWRGQEATTDPQGEYRFEPLKTGAMTFDDDQKNASWHTGVTVDHPTLVTSDGLSWRDISVPRVAGHEHVLDFTLVPGGFVSGWLLKFGTPEPAPNVDLRLGSPSTRDGKYFVYATTDKAGRFVSKPLFPGKYELDVNSVVPRYPKLAKNLAVVAGQNITGDFEITADDLTAYREHEQQQIAQDKERQIKREQAESEKRANHPK